MWFPILITVLTGYLLGNLNGAVSMSVLFGNDDVRSHGSGNAGLTNFVRSFGFAKAGLVILIDVLKALIACAVGKLLLTPYGYALEGAMLGAVAVSLGHDFPALLGFRGGKGILCGFAVAACLDWRCALIILAIFIVCYLATEYVSLGSVMGALGFAIGFSLLYHTKPLIMIGGIFLGLLAIFMHRKNIVRLCKGTESKVSFRKKGKTGSI